MYVGRFVQTLRRFADPLSHFSGVYSKPHFLPDGRLPLVRKDAAKHQDRFFYAAFAKEGRLVQRCHRIAPDIILGFQHPGDLYRPMAISVRFDHGDHGDPFLYILFHHLHIVLDGVQVDSCTYSVVLLHALTLLTLSD